MREFSLKVLHLLNLKMLYKEIAMFSMVHMQGQQKRSGCSGFGRTSFSQGKNEIQFLQKAINKQKC